MAPALLYLWEKSFRNLLPYEQFVTLRKVGSKKCTMCLWVILKILIFSSISFCNGGKLSFHTSFGDLLSLGKLSNPWRQGNLLPRQPGNSLQTYQPPRNSFQTNQPPRNSTWTNHCVLRTVSSSICYCCLANPNQRNKTYWNYFYADFICPRPSMVYLTSTSKFVPLILYRVIFFQPRQILCGIM